MPSVELNPKRVTALRCEPGRAFTVFWDTAKTAPPWFGLRVTADGVRAWVQGYRAKDTAAKRLATLGRAASVPLSDARALGHELLRSVAKGRDPVRERRERKRAAAVADLVRQYVEHGKTRRGKPRAAKTQGDYRRAYKRNIERSDFGRKKPAEITSADVERFVEDKAALAPVMADRLQALIRSTFRWAVRKGLVTADPTLTLDRVIAKVERERVLSEAEIAALWNALDVKDDNGIPKVFPRAAAAVRFLLLLGQRFGETFAMRWEHLDLAAKRWNVPGATRKGGRGHVVPLPAQAVTILESLGPKDGGLVFAGPEGGSLAANPVRIKDAVDDALKLAAARAAREAGGAGEAVKSPVAAWRFHDLRRTCATGCAALGASESTVARLLGHKLDPGGAAVTAVYQRFDRLPEVAAALAAWAAHVEALAAGKARKGADVVPLTRGKRRRA